MRLTITVIENTIRNQLKQNKDPSDPRFSKINLSSKHTQ